MSDVSERWLLASLAGGARPITIVTVTPPGEDTVELAVDGCAVTISLDTGPRYQANVTAVRIPGQNTLDLCTTPGAIFTIETGWDYGAGQVETIPFGVYELGTQPKASRDDSVPLALIDQWKRLDECRFLTPYTISVGADRVAAVSARVTAAIPGVTVRISVDGGKVGAANTWDQDRTAAINDLARDGGFSAGFAADGAFEIKPGPILSPPSAAYTDGFNATILDLSTEETFTRLYNAVQVNPTEGQVWAAGGVRINDPDSPRDPSKIGVRPFFASAPTAGSTAEAVAVAAKILPRVIGITREVEVTTWGQAHREPGETFTTTQAGTYADSAESSKWLVESVAHNCLTVETTIVGRDVAAPIIEET